MSEILGRLSIPDIEIPFPRNRHDEQHLAHQMTRTWAVTHSVMAPDLVSAFLDDLCYTDLIGGYYVGAPLPVLAAINDFSLWFFVWDDRHDRDIRHRRYGAWSRLRDALHLALDEPRRDLRQADPLVGAFSDCVVRLCGLLSGRWNTRFVTHFHATIDAYDREYQNRITGTVPTVEQYLALRRHTFGMWVWIDCLELAADFELPDLVRTSAPYQRAALASQEFSAWYNDLHSMPKEIAAGDFHNLVIVLAHQEHLSIPQAAEHVICRLQDRIVDYENEERKVLRLMDDIQAGPELRVGVERCLFNMRNWISSVYRFHYESGRYRVDSWVDPAKPPYVRDPDD
jgi:epi-isozizaene synthase